MSNGEEASQSLGERIKRNYQEHRISILITLFVLVFFLLYLAPAMFIFIGAGKAGVRWRRFEGGVQTNVVYGEGTHIIPPWDTMTIYDVRVNQVGSQFSALSINGLRMQVETSVRYYPKKEYLGLLHQQIGPEYVEKIVLPEIQAAIRRIFGKYTPEEIYQSQGDLGLTARNDASRQFAQRFIVLDDLLFKSIELPPTIQSAIQTKLVAQQQAEEMNFRIDQALKEKERKLIEAEGVLRFNTTIGDSFTEAILRYKGLEVYQELAKHGNTNTFVFGAGNLPFVLGVPTPTPTPTPTASPSASPTPPGESDSQGQH
jgi:regulator of protease activity HflC (stomatin/prohibitin superfamily)